MEAARESTPVLTHGTIVEQCGYAKFDFGKLLLLQMSLVYPDDDAKMMPQYTVAPCSVIYKRATLLFVTKTRNADIGSPTIIASSNPAIPTICPLTRTRGEVAFAWLPLGLTVFQ